MSEQLAYKISAFMIVARNCEQVAKDSYTCTSAANAVCLIRTEITIPDCTIHCLDCPQHLNFNSREGGRDGPRRTSARVFNFTGRYEAVQYV